MLCDCFFAMLDILRIRFSIASFCLETMLGSPQVLPSRTAFLPLLLLFAGFSRGQEVNSTGVSNSSAPVSFRRQFHALRSVRLVERTCQLNSSPVPQHDLSRSRRRLRPSRRALEPDLSTLLPFTMGLRRGRLGGRLCESEGLRQPADAAGKGQPDDGRRVGRREMRWADRRDTADELSESMSAGFALRGAR